MPSTMPSDVGWDGTNLYPVGQSSLVDAYQMCGYGKFCRDCIRRKIFFTYKSIYNARPLSERFAMKHLSDFIMHFAF